MGQFNEKMTFAAGANFKGTVSLPSGSAGDAQGSTANPFDTDKTKHQHQPIYAQGSATTTTDETRTIHVAKNSGTVIAFAVGSIGACVGAAVVDFDLLKNGTTVLTTATQITSATGARGTEAGSLDPAEVAYVAGDVFEIDIDETTGGGTQATGAFAQPTFDESYDS